MSSYTTVYKDLYYIIVTNSPLTSLYIQCSALYTSPPDAGTLLIYEPVDYDKEFYDSCCPEGTDKDDLGGCNLFYVRRAVDKCEQYSPPFCCGKSAPSHSFSSRYLCILLKPFPQHLLMESHTTQMLLVTISITMMRKESSLY